MAIIFPNIQVEINGNKTIKAKNRTLNKILICDGYIKLYTI